MTAPGKTEAVTGITAGPGSDRLASAITVPETGARMIGELLRRAPELTAVMAADDDIALGAMRTLRELGISPTDEEMREMAAKCIRTVGGPAGVVRPLQEEDIVNIYRMAG